MILQFKPACIGISDYDNQIFLDQTLIAFSRLFSRDFNRAALFRWCNPLEVALSILDVASRYAAVAASFSLLEISLSSFLMDERNDERWLVLCMRRLSFCRARFFACGEFAKCFPLQKRSNYGRANMVNFVRKVKSITPIMSDFKQFPEKCR